MKKTLFSLPVLALAATLAASSTRAQTFTVGYDFKGTNGGAGAGPGTAGAPEPATATDPSLTLGDMTRGSGIVVGNNGPGFNADGYYFFPKDATTKSSVAAATAAQGGQYITFTLTPTQDIQLTDLVFGAAHQNGDNPPTGLTGLSYSTDGTTFTEITPTSNVHTGDDSSTQPTIGTFNLGTLGTLTSAGTVTFRLFDLDTGNAHGYEDGTFHAVGLANNLDVEIDGMVAPAGPTGPITPEPGTWAMMIVGAGLLLAVYRARRAA